MTRSLLRKGLIDHSDSLGAAARFGHGDVQWLTAGRGIVHSEMFPLLRTDEGNPLEMFQIWLNLPRHSKMAEPYFTMMWKEDIPRRVVEDAQARKTEVTVIAGCFDDVLPINPPPDSWAAQPEADLAIWILRMEPGAGFQLPAARSAGAKRTLYFFEGEMATVAGHAVQGPAAIEVDAGVDLSLIAGADACEFLMLQGKPIGEAVVQYGPFVMNSQAEIAQAVDDYRRTQFGGWPFQDVAPVHGPAPERFATFPDGRTITPPEPRTASWPT